MAGKCLVTKSVHRDRFVTDESECPETGTFSNLHRGAWWSSHRLQVLQLHARGQRGPELQDRRLLRPPCPLPPQALPRPARGLLTFAGEVLDGHVLDGNLLEEEWLLAPRVPTDDPPLPQPLAEPGQVAVAVEGVGQEVSGGREGPSLSGSLLLWQGLVLQP